jgi:putative chitinase
MYIFLIFLFILLFILLTTNNINNKLLININRRAIMTKEQFHRILNNKNSNIEDMFYPVLNYELSKSAITANTNILAAFLAQTLYESNGYRNLEEIASGRAYDDRKDLGNTLPAAIDAAERHHKSTGEMYKGRGLIQLTGYYNYKACGDDLGLDLVNRPELLATPVYAVQSAVWFWNKHHLSSLALKNDFDKITRVINGGTLGGEIRKHNYERIKTILTGNLE